MVLFSACQLFMSMRSMSWSIRELNLNPVCADLDFILPLMSRADTLIASDQTISVMDDLLKIAILFLNNAGIMDSTPNSKKMRPNWTHTFSRLQKKLVSLLALRFNTAFENCDADLDGQMRWAIFHSANVAVNPAG